MKKETFHVAFSKLLGQNLKKFMDNRKLDREACLGIYQTIYETTLSVITECELQLSNDGVNYVAQCFYDGVLINGTHELDPNVFTKRAKLDDISSKDLVTLAAMLEGTDFRVDVVQALKRRN